MKSNGEVPYKIEPPLAAVSNNSPNARQVGGDHYKKYAIQPWDYLESIFSQEAFVGFLRGNIIKYVSRYLDKGGVQDLEKCRHYLDKLIQIERGEGR